MLNLVRNDGFVFFHFVECNAEYIAEDGFTGEKSVSCLLDVVGMRIVVHLIGNLVDAR